MDVQATLARMKATAMKRFVNPYKAMLSMSDTIELRNKAASAGINTVWLAAIATTGKVPYPGMNDRSVKPWLRWTCAVAALGYATELAATLSVLRANARFHEKMHKPVDVEGPTSSWNPNPYES